MKTNRLPVTSILIEMFSVVFAVLLALGVNEWRNDKSNEELGLSAYNKITMEIKNNHKKISGIIENHKKILNDVDSVISRLRQNRTDITFGQVQFDTPSSTAWEAAKLTNAVNYLQYDKVEKISEVYSAQRIYSDVSDRVFQELVFFVPDKDHIKMIDQFRKQKVYLLNLISIEKQLIETYDNFFKP